jgi:transcriptional regulator with XRE-family HTH domain
MGTLKVSAASQALTEWLKTEGATAKLARDTECHRTQLWRYATGRSKPDAELVAKLHRFTEGAVPADGWETILESPESEPGDAA